MDISDNAFCSACACSVSLPEAGEALLSRATVLLRQGHCGDMGYVGRVIYDVMM